MITIRPYQAEAIASILADWNAGYKNVMITASTGSGKTAIFLTLLHQQLKPGERALILAHRKELIDQPRDRMLSYYPEWSGKIGIVMADTNEPDRQITVATVQTLYSDKRMAELLSYGKIDYLVTDEAHHSTINNSTYAKTLAALRAANPDMKHLGVTATPIRADGDGLRGVYEKESYHYGIIEGIKTGFLVPVRWLAIQVGISLADVNVVAGDFVAKKLADVFETSNCFDLVVESHKKYATTRQALAFTVSVAGAYALRDTFLAAGITAAAADGTTNKKVRQNILDDFRTGKTQVLCNVGLFTEGLDVPEVSCIHQVRPTKSDGLYTQILGRSLRIFPGKVDALILDYCPVESRNIAMAGDVLGTPLRKEAYVKEAGEKGDVLGGFTFDGEYKWLDGNPAEIISRQLDYLDISIFHWYRTDGGTMSLGLGKADDEVDRTLMITAPHDGKVKLYLVAKKPEERWKSYRVMEDEFDKVQAWAEDYANKRGDAILAQKSKKWHKQSPSEPQFLYAQRLGLTFETTTSRGELAQMITHAIANRAIGG